MTGFVPPPYPYDLLRPIIDAAAAHEGGAVDLSIGAPSDAPLPAAVAALASSNAERGYPPSIGTPAFRAAAAAWMQRRTKVTVSPETEVAAAVGSKEFVAGLPNLLRLRTPERDTVLYPAVSYPTYEMGAILGGCRAVAVPVRSDWTIDLDAIEPADAARALVLWVNTPGNPAGGLDDLEAVAAWGRANDVLVVSDECYIEFTWDGAPRSILHQGTAGVLAVHSLSKRSNFAGVRAAFYAGDSEVVAYLREVRKHAGLVMPGPAQAAAVVALEDDDHVDEQRERYYRRLALAAEIMAEAGAPCELPRGGFYLWVPAPDGDAWAFAARLAERAGIVVSPGEFYGPQGAGHVRVAVVAGTDRLELALRRLRASA